MVAAEKERKEDDTLDLNDIKQVVELHYLMLAHVLNRQLLPLEGSFHCSDLLHFLTWCVCCIKEWGSDCALNALESHEQDDLHQTPRAQPF